MGGFFIFPLPLRERVRVRGKLFSNRLRRCLKVNCGWLRPCTLGSISFVRPKEMDERKGRPDGVLILRFAPRAWRSPDSTSLCWRPTRGIPPAPLRALGPRLAMLRRAIRDLKTPTFSGLRLTQRVGSINMVQRYENDKRSAPHRTGLMVCHIIWFNQKVR